MIFYYLAIQRLKHIVICFATCHFKVFPDNALYGLPVTVVTIIIILIKITIQVPPKPCGCQHPCGCEKPCTFSELKVKFLFW